MQIGKNDQGEPIADFGAETAQAQTGQIVDTVFDVSTADFEDKVMRASSASARTWWISGHRGAALVNS